MAAASVASWTEGEVVDWLAHAGLGTEAVDCFRRARLTGVDLLGLQRESLRQLGVTALADRKLLWELIQGLQSSPGAHPPASARPPCLSPAALAAPPDDAHGAPASGADADGSTAAASSPSHPQHCSGSVQSPDWTASCGYSSYSGARWSYGSSSSHRSSSVWSDRSSVPSEVEHGAVRPRMLSLSDSAQLPAEEARLLAAELARCVGGEVTPQSLALCIQCSQSLCERVLGAVLSGLAPRRPPDPAPAPGPPPPGGPTPTPGSRPPPPPPPRPPSPQQQQQQQQQGAAPEFSPDAPLPRSAARLVAVYAPPATGTAPGQELTLRGAAAQLRRSGGLPRLVHDALRMVDGITPLKGRQQVIPAADLAVVAQVFRLQGLLPPPDAVAPAPSAEQPQRRRQLVRIRCAAPPPPAGRRRMVAAALRRLVRHSTAAGVSPRHADPSAGATPRISGGAAAGVNAAALAAALREQGALAERLWRVVLTAVSASGEGPRAAPRGRSAPPDGQLVAAAAPLLRVYGIQLGEGSAAPDPAEVSNAQAARGWERFVSDSLRVCHGVDRSRAAAAAPLSDGDLAAFAYSCGLAELLLPPDDGAPGDEQPPAPCVPPAPGPAAPSAAPPPPRPQGSPPPSGTSGDSLHVGDAVTVLGDAAEVRRLVAGTPRLGWQDCMAACLGTKGRVKRHDERDRRRGWVQVHHESGDLWTWPVGAVRKA
eukprot:TRINITY_DN8696_c0_g1_i2.p1 TRINITY_DN8696_c0_g1~~TRINITY_DN8696_c0_g1_i2.p1  ORF type:complete len:709 (+),score=196.02 TRINITY_DN8696_c0_g1_i2:60-2186(+)